MITTQDTDPLAQTQQRLDAVLLRLQRIEEAAETVCPSAGFLADCDDSITFQSPSAGWRELREALDAG